MHGTCSNGTSLKGCPFLAALYITGKIEFVNHENVIYVESQVSFTFLAFGFEPIIPYRLQSRMSTSCRTFI